MHAVYERQCSPHINNSTQLLLLLVVVAILVSLVGIREFYMSIPYKYLKSNLISPAGTNLDMVITIWSQNHRHPQEGTD